MNTAEMQILWNPRRTVKYHFGAISVKPDLLICPFLHVVLLWSEIFLLLLLKSEPREELSRGPGTGQRLNVSDRIYAAEIAVLQKHLETQSLWILFFYLEIHSDVKADM